MKNPDKVAVAKLVEIRRNKVTYGVTGCAPQPVTAAWTSATAHHGPTVNCTISV